jgi:ribosomal protein S18 acetylase RimI-like enzyme
MGAIGLREADAGDAAAIRADHVASWREAYAGILPDEMLKELSAESRAGMWGAVLEDPAAFGDCAIFVAERDEEIVGFGTCFRQRDEALAAQGFAAEIGAIYVLRAHQGAGLGRSLMRLMAQRLVDQSRGTASLWVLRENAKARAFYERLGGVLVGEKAEDQSGVMLAEVAYGWRDLSALLR